MVAGVSVIAVLELPLKPLLMLQQQQQFVAGMQTIFSRSEEIERERERGSKANRTETEAEIELKSAEL